MPNHRAYEASSLYSSNSRCTEWPVIMKTAGQMDVIIELDISLYTYFISMMVQFMSYKSCLKTMSLDLSTLGTV